MIRSDRQQLIDRFNSGAMSPAEQRAFHAQLASDPELRSLVAADEAISSAVRVDRAAWTRGATVPSEQLSGLLAASRVAVTSGATAGGLGLAAKLGIAFGSVGLAVLATVASLPLLLSDQSSLDVGSRIPVSRPATQTAPPRAETPATAEPAPATSTSDLPRESVPERRSVRPMPGARTPARDMTPRATETRRSSEVSRSESEASQPSTPREIPVFEDTDVTVEVEPSR